jgi:hypothetical protein
VVLGKAEDTGFVSGAGAPAGVVLLEGLGEPLLGFRALDGFLLGCSTLCREGGNATGTLYIVFCYILLHTHSVWSGRQLGMGI